MKNFILASIITCFVLIIFSQICFNSEKQEQTVYSVSEYSGEVNSMAGLPIRLRKRV